MSKVLEEINRLSSAEEVFDCLGLQFDQEVLNVSRLHIMKRFGAYLKAAELGGLDDAAMRDTCGALLARAYSDFIESTPLKEKVFKVFVDEAEKHAARFVRIDSLKVAGA